MKRKKKKEKEQRQTDNKKLILRFLLPIIHVPLLPIMCLRPCSPTFPRYTIGRSKGDGSVEPQLEDVVISSKK